MCSGAEERGHFFKLAGCDIFVELRDTVLSAKLQTHLHGHNLGLEERICNGADASSEETPGRTPAWFAEAHRDPRQDADHTRKHLEPSSLAVIVQTESSSAPMISDAPGKLPELLIASLVLWLEFNWSLYKDDKVKQLLKCKCSQPFPFPEKIGMLSFPS